MLIKPHHLTATTKMRSFLSSTSSSSNVRTKAIVMNTTTTTTSSSSSSSSIKQKSKQVSKAIRRQKTNLIHHPSSSSSNEERRFKSMLTVSASTAANDVVATNDSNNKETFEYQAEVNRLMDLIVNSLYSNKDVFLRELISNASDACDKLRFRSVQEPELMNGQSITDLRIKLKGSSDLSSLTIEDNGIGMSKDELIANLGTIANSGTSKVMEMLKKQNADKSSGENLIGKFGVGFYSSFLVADAVKVTSKSNDDQKAWTWESLVNSSSYTIREATEEEAKDLVRGTRISLKLKDDCDEYATDTKLSSLIKTYSEFITFPIEVYSTIQKTKQVEDVEATKEKKEKWTKKKIEAEAKGEEFSEAEPSKVMKDEMYDEQDWKTQNNDKPIWTLTPKDVTDEQYNEFFKSTFREFLDPLAVNHFKVEGDMEFKSILYIPGMAPFEQQDMMQKSKSIKLFVRKVFISDEFDEALLPRYMTFIRGIVDSNDLPLNVSREILQESKVVRVIKRRLVSKTFAMLKEIAARENDDYKTFWDSFGRQLKLGVIEDVANRKELAGLLRFTTNKSKSDEESNRSLTQYIADMKEGQKSIYFVAGDTRKQCENSPFMEKLNKLGFEVLFCTDPIDEVSMANLATFEEKEIKDISKEDLDLGDDDDEEQKKKNEQIADEFKTVTEWLKKELVGSVEKVEVSSRLTETPCILVTSKFGWSANMERIMKAQAMGDARAQDYMKGKKTLEINPFSPVIKLLKAKIDKAPEAPETKEMCKLLFDTAMLTSGFSIEQPGEFAERVFKLMTQEAKLEQVVTSSKAIEPEVM
jgi:heat shock protein beta